MLQILNYILIKANEFLRSYFNIKVFYLQIEKIIKSINDQRRLCANKDNDDLESSIQGLHELQQIAVQACFKAVNKPANGRRYSLEWIY